MTVPITQWISEHAHRTTTIDTEARLTDLRPFSDIAGDASVVALGPSSRLTHELSAVAHRLVRLLVEAHGFRSADHQHHARASGGLRTKETGATRRVA